MGRDRSWARYCPHTAANKETWAWVRIPPAWAAAETREAGGSDRPANEARGEDTPVGGMVTGVVRW